MNSAKAFRESWFSWDEPDWEFLLDAIEQKRCTPFLGAGMCADILPTGKELARRWAEKCEYPFHDTESLVRVAQYLAVRHGGYPKKKIKKEFEAVTKTPNFDDPYEPHRLLADLRLPIYMTTNYDNFMWKALRREIQVEPQREFCKWYMARQFKFDASPPSALEATPEKPLVFHLHGIYEIPESIVITEDDYLDFLMCISEDKKLIPDRVGEAFRDSTLLFMGYSLEDMNFKVLFRKLAPYLQRAADGPRHIAVQLPPSSDLDPARAALQRQYLERHFERMSVHVYWGSCMDFAKQLRDRRGSVTHGASKPGA